jgi:hypothetical protein
MSDYQAIANSSSVKRLADGVTIPPDPANIDWQAYQAWLMTAGNTLAPVPGPTLTDVKKAQDTAVSTACQAAIIAGFISPALGTANTYTLDPATDQTNLLSAYTAASAAMANAKTWAAGAAASLYEVVLVNGAYYLCTAAGVTGTTAPTWPTAFQQDVTDGAAQWALAGWLLSTASGSQWHTVAQVIAVWQGYLAFVSDCRAKYRTLAAQIEGAATVAAVQAITW